MNCFLLRIRLFLKDKTALICFALTSVIMLTVLLGLNIRAPYMSAIPVGLVTGDDMRPCESNVSGRIASRIMENEALKVHDGDLDALKELLADGYIYCIIEFDPGLDDMVRNGQYEKIMTMHSAKDSPIATIIGDVVAGCAMDEICTNKAYKEYSLLQPEDKEHISIEDYRDRLIRMRNEGGYDFVFNVRYSDTGRKAETDITNALIYRQVISGLIAMLILLTAFCACNPITMEYASGIRDRLRISSSGWSKVFVLEAAALFICCMPVGILAGALSGRDISSVFAMSGLNLLMLLCAIILFYLIASVSGNVFAYQIAGTVLIIVLAGSGFISIFEGVSGKAVFYHTPVAAYIRSYINYF